MSANCPTMAARLTMNLVLGVSIIVTLYAIFRLNSVSDGGNLTPSHWQSSHMLKQFQT